MWLIFILIIAIVVYYCVKNADSGSDKEDRPRPSRPAGSSWFDPPERQAGYQGEMEAQRRISALLDDGDHYFVNVEISYNGQDTELDNLIVNQFGVFIIEVKTYVGALVGGEDGYEWIKLHESDAGNTYEKKVKNPIKQVKRQVWLFKNYLIENGIDVWVDGYAYLLYENSPVESEFMLSDVNEIEKAIHTPGRRTLSYQTIERIRNLLSEYSANM